MTAALVFLDVVLVALLLHTAINARLLRVAPPAKVSERVSILVPMRDEAATAAACLASLRGQAGLDAVEILVLDDGSTDGTGDVVRSIAGVRLMTGTAPPPGALGKPWACAQLAAAATGDVLVFVDADVAVMPGGVAAATALMRAANLQWVSPYPRQVAITELERVVQPLLQWSWLTFLPLRVAERARRGSLAVANGQFLVVDAAAYRSSGGHAADLGDVLDDIAFARTMRAAGFAGGFVDGSGLAHCRMYRTRRALVDGYAKSLWRAFGSPAGGAAVTSLLLTLYVVPWLLVPVTAYAVVPGVLGIAGRLLATMRTRGRRLDAIAHPVSVLVFAALMAISITRHARGRTHWKGRRLP